MNFINELRLKDMPTWQVEFRNNVIKLIKIKKAKFEQTRVNKPNKPLSQHIVSIDEPDGIIDSNRCYSKYLCRPPCCDTTLDYVA